MTDTTPISGEAFTSLVQARRSVRRFSDSPVPEAVMRAALQSAHLAPSSNNLQPWEFHWVHADSPLRRPAVEACFSQPAAATSRELVFFAGRADRLEDRCASLVDHFEAAGNESTALYYRDQVAANIAGMTAESRAAWVDKSVALAAAQFMLAIQAAGFDTCPMEGFNPNKVRTLLGLPETVTVTMAISVGEGTPEGLYGPRLRFPLSDHLQEH